MPSPLARAIAVAFGVVLTLSGPVARAGGIDHVVAFDDSGIWKRRNQILLENGTIVLVLGGALWEGSDERLGRTLWQSVDSMAIGAVTAQGMKYAFSRTRPSETDNPNKWFQGRGNQSFPSGEVMLISTAVTPIVLEYQSQYPAVWALELLPLYDAAARVKVHAHWQTDVLASLAIGTAIGAYSHSLGSSLSVGVLPRGVTVGWKKSF